MRSLIFLLLLSFNATAALYDRGNGLIYDDVLDITWLQDANYAQTSGYDSDGSMTWQQASAWATQLEYSGYDDWRLPSAKIMNAANPCYGSDGSCDLGYNNTTGELGHMFYNNLENRGYRNTLGSAQSGYGVTNSSFIDDSSGASVSILNLINSAYWLEEKTIPTINRDWAFHTFNGLRYDIEVNNIYAWAVHDGDIDNLVPLPAGITLFLSGLVGLGLMRGKNV